MYSALHKMHASLGINIRAPWNQMTSFQFWSFYESKQCCLHKTWSNQQDNVLAWFSVVYCVDWLQFSILIVLIAVKLSLHKLFPILGCAMVRTTSKHGRQQFHYTLYLCPNKAQDLYELPDVFLMIGIKLLSLISTIVKMDPGNYFASAI